MEIWISHETPGSAERPARLRVRCATLPTRRVARALVRELETIPGLSQVSASHLTGKVLFYADTPQARDNALSYLREGFVWREHLGMTAEEMEELLTGDAPGGALIAVARYFLLRPLLPPFWRMVVSTAAALPFIAKGLRSLLRGRLNVDVLDGSALTVSLLMRDFGTAGMLSMLLAVGDALEVWTRQRSLSSLGDSLALNVDSVWILDGEGNEISVPLDKVHAGDLVVVNAGSSIPVDGVAQSGEALVSQAAMTGEPLPVRRKAGAAVYAGTIVEAGRLVIRVTQIGEGTRLHQIVSFIEQSEQQKSSLEAHYQRLADQVVPLTFALAGVVWLLTRSLMRASSVLLVDYSCALKLATPLGVLTAMRSGTQDGVAIRGGRYLEAVREADTLVLDKTGTLTSARPSVAAVIPAPGHSRDEVLRTAACLEEHFPHPVSRAIVVQAVRENLGHCEEHAEVKYVAAHGIASHFHGHAVFFGSRHYLEHDEGVDLSVFAHDIERETALGRTLLFLSDNGQAAGLVAIEDPLRPEAPAVIRAMRSLGFTRILMLTGDDERTARAVAAQAGIDEYVAHVLPTDKGRIIQRLNEEGRKVMMVGDGINDGPALSAASVGVAMGDGTDLARAVANVLLTRPDLRGLPFARRLAKASVRRIHLDVHLAVGLNSFYLLGAMFGLLGPGLTAVLHNLTTIGISLNAIRGYSVHEELPDSP